MELIERIPLYKIYYLNSLTLEHFKDYNKPSTKDKLKLKYETMKSFCQTNIKTKGLTKRIYFLTNPNIQGGRLFSSCGIQALPKLIRGFLMNNKTDIDMKNAHPQILSYLCKNTKSNALT